MARRIFTAQFERDLENLKKSIVYYQETGKPYNLFPHLIRCFNHAWTMKGVLKKEFLDKYYG